MKIFTNKNLIQKLIIAIVCITLLNFCMAPKVQADFGGKMMSYIRWFATALGDVAITLVQFGVTGNWTYAVDDKGTGEPQIVDGKKSDYWIKDSKFEYPIIQLSPELIFGDKVELLGIDFIGGDNGAEGDDKYILKTDGSAIESLRVIIASWYVTLRTIAIVGLLSVLIYIGIRIIISSTSQDRAKYKQRLVDWIIAFCLIFFMHYIMAAAVNVVGQVNDILAKNIVSGIKLSPEFGNVKYDLSGVEANENGGTIDEYTQDLVNFQTQIESVAKVNANGGENSLGNAISLGWVRLESAGFVDNNNYVYKYSTQPDTPESIMGQGTLEVKVQVAEDRGHQYVVSGSATSSNNNIFKSGEINNYLRSLQGFIDNDSGLNFTTPEVYDANAGTAKTTPKSADGKPGHDVIVSQTAVNDGDGSEILYYINYARLYLNVSTKDKYIAISVGYLILYLVLVVFTIMFTVRYMKRVIYVAFLTLIAPMVAMTYPLDKIKDRKSTSI